MGFLDRVMRSGRGTALLFVVASVLPLVLLAVSSTSITNDAVNAEVMERVETKARLTASHVDQEIAAIGSLVDAFSNRGEVATALGSGDRGSYDMGVLDRQLAELFSSREGVRTAFLADSACTAWVVVPPLPSAIGENFAHRDWCRGVQATGDLYVSEAFTTTIEGRPPTVSIVAPVFDPSDRDGTPLGYVSVAYDFREIDAFLDEIARYESAELTLFDAEATQLSPTQRSDGPNGPPATSADNPVLAEAWSRGPGVSRISSDDGDVLVALSQIDRLGWVVVAEVSAGEALAAVSDLRRTVISIATVMGAVLLAGAAFIGRAAHHRRQVFATTERKDTQMTDILNSSDEAFMATDDHGLVTAWNTAAEEMFGWSAAETRGRPIATFIAPPETRHAHLSGIQRMIDFSNDGKSIPRTEMNLIHRNGRRFPAEATITATQIDGHWRFSSFVRDISERRQRETNLARARDHAIEASALKSDFLATMSHEIRTPMNGVLGMNALLLDSDLTDQQRKDAETVRRSGEALLAIINDILDFSKIEAGQLDIEHIEFDLHELVDDVIAPMRTKAASKNIELLTRLHPDLPDRVVGDPVRTRQILVNLVGNAIKFTERGHVTVTVTDSTSTHDRGELRFEVADTGIGISPAAQDTVFDTFAQADATTTRRFGGTGLGLAICKRLADLMGGNIGVTSTAGRGSTFWFTIPNPTRTDTAPLGPTSELAATDDASIALDAPLPLSARVLLAEDNDINQDVARRMLESIGCDVEVVSDGAEAIAAARNQTFDVILMDLHMPNVDGLEAARAIRARERTPIIAVSASATEADQQRCADAGMDAHLAKPFNRADLTRLVHQALTGSNNITVATTPEPPTSDSTGEHDLAASITERLDELYEDLDIDSPDERNRLLQSFLTRSSDEIQAIETAIAATDHEHTELHAHSLKGMASNVGINTIAKHAAAIEDAARNSDHHTLATGIEQLHTARTHAEHVITSIHQPNNHDSPRGPTAPISH